MARSRREGETAAPRAPASKRYRKGEETRRRILDAALREFGAVGAAGATTRKIAQEAVVSLPALKYYFGGKRGLYLACARQIVSEYQAHMLVMLAGVRASLDEGASAEAARAHLKAVLDALVDLQIGRQQSDVWMSFVLREIAEKGPAFGLLFEQLWAPGVDLVAELIGRIAGDRPGSMRPRLQALLLVSSLSAFSLARPIALRYLRWMDLAPASIDEIKAVLARQVDEIGAGGAS
ncbi:MAG: CerR family C-terminal domain-containing protein [Caulobacteraceae bacterium]